MTNLTYLIAVFLPIITGAVFLVKRRVPRMVRETVLLVSALITSGLVVAMLVFRPEPLTLLTLNESLSLTFRIDNLSLVFAAILAVLWPIADLYSFEYMSHEHGENRFFGFFTMTEGVVLGIALPQTPSPSTSAMS